jgi:hypothetical protein
MMLGMAFKYARLDRPAETLEPHAETPQQPEITSFRLGLIKSQNPVIFCNLQPFSGYRDASNPSGRTHKVLIRGGIFYAASG